MLSCEGYKMFLGTMKIKPKNADISSYEVYGHWLFKPDINCWYCNGSSYPADICEVGTDPDIYVTEFCPHCETEQTISWDVTKRGYKAFCPTCGKELLLCSECDGSKECGHCDWSEETGCYMAPNKYDNSDSEVIFLQECTEPGIFYGYFISKSVTAEELQKEICRIKNDSDFLEKFPEWAINDVFAQFPKEWNIEFISTSFKKVEI